MSGIADMLISGYGAGNQLRVQREAEQKQRGLASLYQQAYQAPVAEQRGIVSQAMGIDPGAGMQLQRGLGQDNSDQAHRLVGMAQALAQTPEEMRPQMYAAILPELKRMGIPVQDHYDPSVMQVAQQVLQKVYGSDAEQFTLSPGSRRYDASGKVIAEVPFAPTRDNWDVVSVPDGKGGTVQMEHNATTGAWREPQYGGAQAMGGGAGQVMGDALTQAMIGAESGGDPNAVSPAGARGLMQVMPDTARNPGFGVKPMQGDSPQENVRFGQDYFKAMLAKYGGNQQLALMAYNGGPGRVDSALQRAGGDPQQAAQYLPQETQQYPGRVQSRLGYSPPKQGADAPSGYRYKPDGALEPIPGGPADKTSESPGDLTKTGDAYLATISPQQAAQVKALAEGRMAFPAGAALRSPYWQGMLSAVSQFDPTFDAVNYNARSGTRKAFTSGKEAQQINALNTVAEHLGTFSDNAQALHNTSFQLWNKIKNAVAEQTGDPDIARFNTAKKAVADEIAKVWRASGGSEADIQENLKNLSGSQSQAQLDAAIGTLTKLIYGKVAALQEQYTSGMGTSQNPRALVSPEAQKAYDKTLNRMNGIEAPASNGGWSATRVK